jgi:hypothetical protein
MRQDLLHRAHSGSADERSLAAWVDNLMIANARQREALALIRSIDPAYTYTGRCETCTAMRDTARQALEVQL